MKESKYNNTYTPLDDDEHEIFLGKAEDMFNYNSIQISAKAVGDAGLNIVAFAEFTNYTDFDTVIELGSIVVDSNNTHYTAVKALHYHLPVRGKYFRLRLVNLSVTDDNGDFPECTTLECTTFYKKEVLSENVVEVNHAGDITIDTSTPLEVNHAGDITIDTSTPLEVNHAGDITIDTSTPLEVNHAGDITIDTSTPLEVNHAGDITIDTSTPLEVNHAGDITIDTTVPLEVNHAGDITIDTSTPLEVNHAGDITIDTSTPLDVNVTNEITITGMDGLAGPHDLSVNSDGQIGVVQDDPDNLRVLVYGNSSGNQRALQVNNTGVVSTERALITLNSATESGFGSTAVNMLIAGNFRIRGIIWNNPNTGNNRSLHLYNKLDATSTDVPDHSILMSQGRVGQIMFPYNYALVFTNLSVRCTTGFNYTSTSSNSDGCITVLYA
jgi:hypothetical protein